MSLQKIKDAIDKNKMRCPVCKGPVQKYEKFVEMVDQIWDGAGDSNRQSESAASKVTLICGNGSCDWKERTEYWNNYIDE